MHRLSDGHGSNRGCKRMAGAYCVKRRLRMPLSIISRLVEFVGPAFDNIALVLGERHFAMSKLCQSIEMFFFQMQQTIIEHLVPLFSWTFLVQSARAKPKPFSQAPGKIVPVTKIPGTFGRQLTQIWVWASHATTATTLGVMFMMSPSLN